MPTNLQFSDHDIAALATELDINLSFEEKINVLKASVSCDVQAGPGCGKTTILTAKLALLATEWHWADRGILVLSHTNVARREIESRLGQSKALSQLLGYPHFIGTFQSFVDQYLALPFLRQEGKEIIAVDNEQFADRALRKFASREFSTARSALTNRSEGLDVIIGGLRFEGAQLKVTNPAANNARFPGPTSATGLQLNKLKTRLAEEGYFRFDDMYAYAEACLAQRKYLYEIIRYRFPWIFVDELQDTNESQDRILEALFAVDSCILQKFGDKNQAIFSFDSSTVIAPELFGRRQTLPLSETHRFGSEIAGFASALTVVQPQTLKTTELHDKCKHTVFVFDKTSIDKVVPCFADLVIDQVPAALRDKRGVCVVGGRKNIKDSKPHNFPEGIGDYWSGFRSDISRKAQAPDSLYGFVIEARLLAGKDHSFSEALRRVEGAVLEYIRRAASETVKPKIRTRTELREVLKETGIYLEYRELLWKLLKPDADLSETVWADIVRMLTSLLKPVIEEPQTSRLQNFLTWNANSTVVSPTHKQSRAKGENVLVHSNTVGSVALRFDSIHGVKGETHAATLVVETFNRTHDLKALLKVLTGEQKASSLATIAIDHCKRVFVGMTRPTDLVCLAIYQDHITEKQADLLRKAGWDIQRLSPD